VGEKAQNGEADRERGREGIRSAREKRKPVVRPRKKRENGKEREQGREAHHLPLPTTIPIPEYTFIC